jgi:hypothetical protein
MNENQNRVRNNFSRKLSLTRFLPVIALLLSACALRAPSPEAFSFAAMGDTPYSDREEAHFLDMMKRVDAEPVEFVIHVGDLKSGASDCTDELFVTRRKQFDDSAHPFIFTPGDNEWTDCRFNKPRKRDPLERLAKLREVFFSEPQSLGRSRIPTAMQGMSEGACGAYPENRAWTRAGVRFVTLNVPGSHNNVGFDAASDAEARCRNAANGRWLERAVAETESPAMRGLVIAIQADPWDSKKNVYGELRAQIQAAAVRLRKPVLFVHGDTHLYRFDTPFRNASGDPIANLQRLEVYGSPAVGWVKVDVDPAGPELFRVAPHLQAIVP